MTTYGQRPEPLETTTEVESSAKSELTWKGTFTYLVDGQKDNHRNDDNRCPQGGPSRPPYPQYRGRADGENLPRATISTMMAWRKVEIYICSKEQKSVAVAVAVEGERRRVMMVVVMVEEGKEDSVAAPEKG